MRKKPHFLQQNDGKPQEKHSKSKAQRKNVNLLPKYFNGRRAEKEMK